MSITPVLWDTETGGLLVLTGCLPRSKFSERPFQSNKAESNRVQHLLPSFDCHTHGCVHSKLVYTPDTCPTHKTSVNPAESSACEVKRYPHQKWGCKESSGHIGGLGLWVHTCSLHGHLESSRNRHWSRV